ncbi:hypothetical protein C5167_021246 [Papaver somniferum]|uniref:Uncharacterized protein n=1 Tax=Papaver somniferum TaxID=3469 RepID=A0A4Y7IYE9_PAPSO|nr:hypothetical protein C5167_021246 [Papaver somniferum]
MHGSGDAFFSFSTVTASSVFSIFCGGIRIREMVSVGIRIRQMAAELGFGTAFGMGDGIRQ